MGCPKKKDEEEYKYMNNKIMIRVIIVNKI